MTNEIANKYNQGCMYVFRGGGAGDGKGKGGRGGWVYTNATCKSFHA